MSPILRFLSVVLSTFHSFAQARTLPQSFRTLGPPGIKGPQHDEDTYVGIINATPYRWRRGFNHSYQMALWEHSWPKYIVPGQSVEVLAQHYGGFIQGDSAGEVAYHLEGTSKPMSFMIEYRRGIRHSVWIRFMEELATLNNAKGTVHDLGFLRIPGGVGFILAGSEESFISNDPPLDWMQAQLPTIGHLPLREIVITRSHHAGMWKSVSQVGFGSSANTKTQNLELKHQLGNGGIRILDVRATLWRGEFRESHVSKIGALGYSGMIGAGVPEMIDVLNNFTSTVPGELFIWDIHPVLINTDNNWGPLNEEDRLHLFNILKRIRHRVSVPDDEDITQWPLERFIGNRTTAVLILVRSSLAEDPNFPGGAEGFVTHKNFPCDGRWSNRGHVERMVKDQLEHLRKNRPNRSSQIWNTDWILTQKNLKAIFPIESILTIAAPAWRSLYHEFWDALTDETYPNWLSMDRIHGNQLKAIVMAMNHCLAARKCGSLGGKVKLNTEANRGVGAMMTAVVRRFLKHIS